MSKKAYRSPISFTLPGGDDFPIDLAASELVGYDEDVMEAWEAFLADDSQNHDLHKDGVINIADFLEWYNTIYGGDDDPGVGGDF